MLTHLAKDWDPIIVVLVLYEETVEIEVEAISMISRQSFSLFWLVDLEIEPATTEK